MSGHVSEEELGRIYTFAIQLGKDAGQMLLKAAETQYGSTSAPIDPQQHVEKENAVDIVTQTDEGRTHILQSS